MRLLSVLHPFVLAALFILAVGIGTAHAQMEMPPRSFGEVVERAEAQGTPS